MHFNYFYCEALLTIFMLNYVNPRTYKQIHTPAVVEGEDGWNPSPEFLICFSIFQSSSFLEYFSIILHTIPRKTM